MLSSFSPLMVAPSIPTATSSSYTSPTSTSPYNRTNPSSVLSPTSHMTGHHTCRVIIGPTDSDYITLIISPLTTVQQLKLDAIKHIATRDHLNASDASGGDVADQYMIVRRINPRALMSSYGSNMSFLPHMNGGLMSSASPFNTMVPGFSPPFSPASTGMTMGTGAVVGVAPSASSPTSASGASRPTPPLRVAPRKPDSRADSPITSVPTSPTSTTRAFTAMLPAVGSSSANDSVATSPRAGTTAASTVTDVQSMSFPLSMFSGGGTLMRLDEGDVIYGRHDDSRYDLLLERLTDDVHIRLSIEDEQLQQQQQQQQLEGTTASPLPVASDIDRTQSNEMASRLAPSSSPSTSGSSVFSFPMSHTSSSATASAASSTQSVTLTVAPSVDMVERESELSAGLDVCLMSIHGTYLQSAGPGDLRVACLDNNATFTLVDSSACDESGQCYRYLRTARGDYLAADSHGTLYLDDVNNQPTGGKQREEKTAATVTDDRSALGLLTRDHRWTIKRGPVQSLMSAYSQYLTIAEEGDLSLTPVRYEESCLHICFAILQGPLRKKQDRGIARLRRWHHKWFVLSGSTLTFYEQQDDIYNRDNNAAIASKLKQQQASSKVSSSHSDSGNTYSTAGILSINVHPAPSCRFDVEFVNGRVLEVKANSDEERERWVAALRNGKVGKRMDAKAKEGKKKKERQQTLRQKQTVAAAAYPSTANTQRWDGEEKTPVSPHALSPSSATSTVSPVNGNRRQAPALRIKTLTSSNSTPSTTLEERQPLAITITHHPATDTPSAVTSGDSSAGGSGRPPAGHTHTPSFTSSPELSLYKSAVGVSPFPLSGAVSPSHSGKSTPFSATYRPPAANKPAGGRRRSLSVG